MPTLYNPNRRWQFTDIGAVQWFALQVTVTQQQATINALMARVAMLEYQHTQKAVNASR